MPSFKQLIHPRISVGIIALNEESYLPDMLSCIEAQDYPHERIQLLLIDSGSHDSTPALMEKFAQEAKNFESVITLPNPGKTLPHGWNVFLAHATGEVLVRVDAHARIAQNFLSSVVEVLQEDEAVAGGPRPTIVPPNASNWQRVLHAAEESLFGASIAKYRSGAKANDGDAPADPQYTSSVFHPGYRRCVIEDVGYFNEDLTRTEDNDYSYRIRKAGYKIRFDSRIYSEQIIRPSLSAMAKQKHANGYWIGRTLFIQPGCIEIYHLVPAAFVGAMIGGIMLALFGMSIPLFLLLGSYALADLALSLLSLLSIKPLTPASICLPLIFPILHISYGIGTWRGIISGAARSILHLLKKGQ